MTRVRDGGRPRAGFAAPAGAARACAALAGLWLALPTPGQAAGGHHAVDDAALLEPGQCQFETWLDRAPAAQRTLLHAGPGCRVVPVELGLNLDRVRTAGLGGPTAAGLQLKWAQALIGDSLRAGVVLAATRQSQAPHFAGGQLVLPLTWQVGPTLQLHANAGRDFLRGEPDSSRAGIAAEWAPSDAWSFVAERFHESGANFARAAARFARSPGFSIDLGRARGLGTAPSSWRSG